MAGDTDESARGLDEVVVAMRRVVVEEERGVGVKSELL